MQSFDLVIPLFNEAECIDETITRIRRLFEKLSDNFKCRMIFVDDGSIDNTVEKIFQHKTDKSDILLVKLSRNFGHQIALTAGLNIANADFIGIIDGDLQDPPELFESMLKISIEQEYDVVYGKRETREGETIFKKFSAHIFYLLLSKLCEVDIPRNTGDFRLITRTVLEKFNQMPERHRFVRGMVPYIGLRSYAYLYSRSARFAGETKYPLRKMIRFSLDAIFSFSTKPIKFIRVFSVFTLLLSIILGVRILFLKIFTDEVIIGYTSTIIIFLFFTSVQMLSISILGEYIGRIFEESKGRPLYFVDYVSDI